MRRMIPRSSPKSLRLGKPGLASVTWVALTALIAAISGGCGPSRKEPSPETFDVVVYGGTSAGVAAAVQASRMGKSVVIVSPDKHLGGLSAGGLGWTDTGDKAVIGGLAREFYQRIWQHYQDPDAWVWQDREEYGNRGQGTPAVDGEHRTMWIFEPHVAESIFEDLVQEHGIEVRRGQWLDRANGVLVNGRRIRGITTRDGEAYQGAAFIDATYEGDLLAAAGVSYVVGRESTEAPSPSPLRT